MSTTILTVQDLEAENTRLLAIIVDALSAMDRGEYGATRTILRTGKDKPLMSTSGVIARDGRPG